RRDVLRGDYAEVNTLRQIANKHNTAMVCVAHSRKAAGDLVDSVIGTSGTTAACDSVWSLKRQTTGEALLEVKGRELEEALYGKSSMMSSRMAAGVSKNCLRVASATASARSSSST